MGIITAQNYSQLKNMRVLNKLIAALTLSMLISYSAFSQDETLKGWHMKDPSEGIYGVGAEKAYELLKDRKPTKVVVAILDSGVDTDHEDLKDNIWVNTGEIAGNGIDDDNNGYVDDVNGWNFLGNSKGENLNEANLEITRIYRKLAPRFQEIESKNAVAKADRADYDLFKKAETEILEELQATAAEFEQINGFLVIYKMADSSATANFGENYTLENLQSWEGDDVQLSKQILSGLVQDPNFSADALEKYHNYLSEKLEFHYNPNFVDRSFIGDDADNMEDRFYGNNDVSAPHDDHGTHVAGIVGAVSGNSIGMDGICQNVELMILRTVPNGDEFDKDIANAIRYAADNGASIINMSFGKAYSPYFEDVQKAIKHAEEKGVLMIHAAGNDAENLDKAANFPDPNYAFEKGSCSTWLTVGASASTGDEHLVGVFSNYGKKSVDLFSPGVQIYSTKPNNTYEFEDGTSMAAPVVSGVAALIKSYFPEISALELKQLLLESSNKYPKLTVLLPDPEYKQSKSAAFKKLSVNGGVVNAYNAAVLALKKYPK
ncbi:MAG: S8 family peptidase [Flavobacteriales bacterium]|nr:S8 family peptidase [Flavobacteriales bacterium]